MSVYVSKADMDKRVNELSDEVQTELLNEFSNLEILNLKVSEVAEVADIKFVDEQLKFYVVDNLRSQQDDNRGFKLTRYDDLKDAVQAFNSFPKEWTSAIGGALGKGEIDFIHRRNGVPVLVNDFKLIDRWDNPLVHRAVGSIIEQLKVEYESDCRFFGNKTVVLPLKRDDDMKLNSYFTDKYLRPAEDDKSDNLLSAVNEVYCEGEGWIQADDFFKKLDSQNEYQSSERFTVTKLNVNYVDLHNHYGQADIDPHDFSLLKTQTIERTAKHPPLDAQIHEAEQIKAKMIYGPARTKGKEMDSPEL